ncbi:uncharacterized protein BO97DRAFT_410956 [Aspergillus homomorphus CBS 101889]|uniref:CCHC-type domain-containing protein n=1 Tax=Aspergillus homomorphus (strain CBS 101889) TaxID=1450537 RepID=A0A395IBW9_ASPHC|nr:hypothetical protein BO97DRAFT_410956 [Aspergillus homomorphus CBS 101889]RAL16588.1 hypothetical protein BO97DRAFT_410956 [Aspergillus homomorphus CBS 101889]
MSSGVQEMPGHHAAASGGQPPGKKGGGDGGRKGPSHTKEPRQKAKAFCIRCKKPGHLAVDCESGKLLDQLTDMNKRGLLGYESVVATLTGSLRGLSLESRAANRPQAASRRGGRSGRRGFDVREARRASSAGRQEETSGQQQTEAADTDLDIPDAGDVHGPVAHRPRGDH